MDETNGCGTETADSGAAVELAEGVTKADDRKLAVELHRLFVEADRKMTYSESRFEECRLEGDRVLHEVNALVTYEGRGLTADEWRALHADLQRLFAAQRRALSVAREALHRSDRARGLVVLRALRSPLSAPELADLLGVNLQASVSGRLVREDG